MEKMMVSDVFNLGYVCGIEQAIRSLMFYANVYKSDDITKEDLIKKVIAGYESLLDDEMGRLGMN